MSLFDTSSELFKTYMFYNGVLVVKMMTMSALTGMQRFKNMAFANPEDAVLEKAKVQVHPDVERVRRAHLNDLENIPIFFVASAAYIATNPPVESTVWLIRAFTIARIIHSFVYAVVVVPQPARGLSWAVGFGITGFMAVKAMMHFM